MKVQPDEHTQDLVMQKRHIAKTKSRSDKIGLRKSRYSENVSKKCCLFCTTRPTLET